MRATLRSVLAVVLGSGVCFEPAEAEAADPEVSVTLAPIRQAFVRGDEATFRAHHWMREGYVGGLQALFLRHVFPDGTAFSAESHALIDQNDLGASFSLKKDALGFFNFEYSEFRKYYDKTGGVYYPFSTFRSSDTFKELELDLGHFGLETGLTLEGWPALAVEYEREFKDGAKSRLTWSAVKEGSVTRYIAPSWQDVDEVVDTFALKARHELAGVALTGEQRWELVRTETLREEKLLATTGAASDTKMRRQDLAPEATLMTTTLGAERRFLNETVFTAAGYHFAHMDNREFETITETNAAGTPTNFSAPKQIRDARADNDYDSHTWVGNVTVHPWRWLSLGTKLKAETIHRESNSRYPQDASPSSSGGSTPDGTIDLIIDSFVKNKAVRWGEGLSLRVTALPRTALYTELELEQARVEMGEDRKAVVGSSPSDVFNRYTITDVRRGAWTLGGRADPHPWLDVTAHVRRRVNDNDYDDQRESVASGTALSAFVDEQNQHTNEFAARATFRPCRWFRSSFRYQVRDDEYATRFEAQDHVETAMTSHIYTFDVALEPLPALLTTASFSRQAAVTTTPASLAASATVQDFHADVNTWLLSATYAPKPSVTLSGTLQFSSADNFNDFTARGMPLGADFHQADVAAGVTWALDDRTAVDASYEFARYNPNENVEAGAYDAHILWLEVSRAF
jgi:hypothetical protein